MLLGTSCVIIIITIIINNSNNCSILHIKEIECETKAPKQHGTPKWSIIQKLKVQNSRYKVSGQLTFS